MDTDQLIIEAEAFSPPKKTSTVYEDSKMDVDVEDFKKIPHGLSHKHSVRHSPNRRNSTDAVMRAPLSVINSSPSSTFKYKDTYTCPRSNTYSGKQLIGLNKLKTNLDSKLKNAIISENLEQDNDKENSFATPSKTQANQLHHSSLLHTPSLSSKRRSSETIESSKRLKSGESLLKTPLRPTEPVAASPSNEQNSRIIDNSHLLLDTRKSPNVSSALTSPLANVSHMNSSHINHSADGIETIDAQTMLAEESLREEDEANSSVAVNSSFAHEGTRNGEIHSDQTATNKLTIAPLDYDQFSFKEMVAEDESDFEPTISSPMSKPTFTVRQMDEIQKDHTIEISKLEDIIQEKSQTVLTLTNNLNVAHQEAQTLDDKLTGLKVENSKLSENNKMMHMRISSIELMSLKLAKQLKQRDHQIKLLQHHAIQLKENHTRLLQSLQERDEEISSLQKNLEHERDIHNESETHIGTLSNTISSLKDELKQKTTEIESLINNRNKLTDQSKEYIEKIEFLNQQQLETNKERDSLIEQLEQKSTEIQDLTEFKNDLETAIENYNNKILDLEEKNSSLVEDLETLSQDFKLKKLESDEQQQEINDLHTSFESKMKELDILFDEKEELLQVSNSLRNDLEEEKEVTKQLYKELKNERQSLSSKVADIDQLQDINDQLDARYENLNTEFIVIQEKQLNLMSDLDEANKTIFALKNLLDKSTKSESELVQGLQAELSNYKNLLALKENDLEIAKKENEQLTTKCNDFDQMAKDILVLKQQLTEQEASSEHKLQQLAQDLYVQYSKKHEQKVSILKKGYETKWSNKFKDLEAENTNLMREVDSLKNQLSNERDEKNQLVKLWDQLVEMEGPNKKLI